MIGEHPYIPLLPNAVGPRFVGVHQRAAHDFLEKSLICFFVMRGCTCLQPINYVSRGRNAEYLLNAWVRSA
jgi:hypothetical protein